MSKCIVLIKEGLHRSKIASLIIESSPNKKIVDYGEDQPNSVDSFILESKHVINTHYNFTKVVGTSHVDYYGHTWGKVLDLLKRDTLNSLECDNGGEYDISYYLSQDKKEHWSIMDYNGVGYIEEGVHRSVAAKFLSELNMIQPIIYGINVHYIKYDEDAYNKYKDVLAFIERSEVLSPHRIFVHGERIYQEELLNTTTESFTLIYKVSGLSVNHTFSNIDELVLSFHKAHQEGLEELERKKKAFCLIDFIKSLFSK